VVPFFPDTVFNCNFYPHDTSWRCVSVCPSVCLSQVGFLQDYKSVFRAWALCVCSGHGAI